MGNGGKRRKYAYKLRPPEEPKKAPKKSLEELMKQAPPEEPRKKKGKNK